MLSNISPNPSKPFIQPLCLVDWSGVLLRNVSVVIQKNFVLIYCDPNAGSKLIPLQYNRTGPLHSRGHAFRPVPFSWYVPHMHSPTCWDYAKP